MCQPYTRQHDQLEINRKFLRQSYTWQPLSMCHLELRPLEINRKFLHQSYTWQPLSMCHLELQPLEINRKFLSIRREPMLSGFSHYKPISQLKIKALLRLWSKSSNVEHVFISSDVLTKHQVSCQNDKKLLSTWVESWGVQNVHCLGQNTSPKCILPFQPLLFN